MLAEERSLTLGVITTTQALNSRHLRKLHGKKIIIMKDPRNRNYWSTTADGRVVKYYNGTQVLITGVNDFRIQLKSVIELMWQDLWEHPKIDEVLSINRCSEEQIEEYKRNSECDNKSCSVMLQDMQSMGKFNIRLMVKHLNEKTSDSNSKCSPTL